MKVIGFAGSNSSTSINHSLITFVSSLMPEMEVIELRKLNIPMYGIDLEKESGIPKDVVGLGMKINSADVIIISAAEHNGNMTAYLKSTIDWLSRNDKRFTEGKRVLVMGTSAGARGAKSSIENVSNIVTRFGGELIGTYSLPKYDETFVGGKIVDEEKLAELKEVLSKI